MISWRSKCTGLIETATIAGGLGVIASLFHTTRERFWANWILWFVFLFTTALGSLFIVALEHLVAARWSVPIRRIPERLGTLLIPVALMAFIGLGALPVLFPGTRAEALEDPVLAGKALWLGTPAFSVRTVLTVVLCLVSLAVLVRGSLKQDQTKDPSFNVRARRFAPGFMAIFALATTLVAFDWIAGLAPSWYSDVFGVYLFAGGFLAGLAATALGLLHVQSRGRLSEIRSDHFYNLGGFLFAFTVFWAYIGFAQYLLMWYANLPEEVVWYRDRLEGGWYAISIALAVLHFLVPFFALVTRDSKGDPRRLLWVCLLMLGCHLLDVYWMVFPVLHQGVLFSWPEICFALLFVGGSLLWLRRAFRWGEDMPIGDPFLREGLEFRL